MIGLIIYFYKKTSIPGKRATKSRCRVLKFHLKRGQRVKRCLPYFSLLFFFASQPPPSPSPPRREPPPHLPIVTNPLAPAQPGLPFLPLFNQAATQRRVKVEYIPEFSGPSHAGRWTVQCVVNGKCKGVGSGSSKQLAKEESARQAYASMGWT